MHHASAKTLPFYRTLYFQVIVGVILGVTVGLLWPEFGAKLKPLGDGFIKLVKMLIAPIIFLTVSLGIAHTEDMAKVGRVGLKALLYFEVVSSLALVIGLVVVNLWQPGAGMNIDPKTLDAGAIASYTAGAKSMNTVDFLLNIIPNSAVDACAEGQKGWGSLWDPPRFLVYDSLSGALWQCSSQIFFVSSCLCGNILLNYFSRLRVYSFMPNALLC